MAIKRDSLDAAFSNLVRERVNNISEYSGKPGPLECCHIYGRRRRSVRWHPMNAVALTHFEHRQFTENPLAFTAWLKSHVGIAHLHTLAEIAAPIRKFSPRELAGLLAHYTAELERLRTARSNGRLGRIEFSFPDPIPEAEPRKRAKKPKPSKFKRKLSGEVVVRKQ